MNVLVIVNDQPYGSERPYNALRLATALSKREGVELRVFLFGDAVMCVSRSSRWKRCKRDHRPKGSLSPDRGRLVKAFRRQAGRGTPTSGGPLARCARNPR